MDSSHNDKTQGNAMKEEPCKLVDQDCDNCSEVCHNAKASVSAEVPGYVQELIEENKRLKQMIIDYANGLVCDKCGGMLFSEKMKIEADKLSKLLST